MDPGQITHVIFDLGGTVLDAVRTLMDMLVDYAAKQDKELPIEFKGRIENALNTLEIIDKFCHIIHENKDIDRKELLDYVLKQVMARGDQLVPGVDRLIKHLHTNDIPMAIATNITEGIYRGLTEHMANYFDTYFKHYVCGADDPEVKLNKPNPDVYIVCSERFKPKPKSLDSVLIFEDSLIGITGAVASGMKTVLINDRKYTNFDAIADKITLIIDSFNDFRPESVGLPAY